MRVAIASLRRAAPVPPTSTQHALPAWTSAHVLTSQGAFSEGLNSALWSVCRGLLPTACPANPSAGLWISPNPHPVCAVGCRPSRRCCASCGDASGPAQPSACTSKPRSRPSTWRRTWTWSAGDLTSSLASTRALVVLSSVDEIRGCAWHWRLIHATCRLDGGLCLGNLLSYAREHWKITQRWAE